MNTVTVNEETKICKKCGRILPMESFRLVKGQFNNPYYLGQCKECEYKSQREYLEKKNRIEFPEDLEILIQRRYKDIKPERILDISNANTIIIHNAEKMGLSQLYQLRGRVGRSNRMAYAFLMYSRNKILTEIAEKRLGAIRDFTELGSGVKIAMRDLEIRGTGNLLGAQQSGHMEDVGYDLYCKMLNQAIEVLKGNQVDDGFETKVDLVCDAYVPASYIKNESIKMDVYKRIAGIETLEEYEDMQDELIDRFGDIPNQVENLLQVVLLKAAAHKAYVTEISGNKKKIKLTMWNQAKVDTARIPILVREYKGRLKFIPGDTPGFEYSPKQGNESVIQLAEKLIESLSTLQ